MMTKRLGRANPTVFLTELQSEGSSDLYDVKLNIETGQLSCGCMAWRFSSKTVAEAWPTRPAGQARWCKHLESMRGRYGVPTPATVDTWLSRLGVSGGLSPTRSETWAAAIRREREQQRKSERPEQPRPVRPQQPSVPPRPVRTPAVTPPAAVNDPVVVLIAAIEAETQMRLSPAVAAKVVKRLRACGALESVAMSATAVDPAPMRRRIVID